MSDSAPHATSSGTLMSRSGCDRQHAYKRIKLEHPEPASGERDTNDPQESAVQLAERSKGGTDSLGVYNSSNSHSHGDEAAQDSLKPGTEEDMEHDQPESDTEEHCTICLQPFLDRTIIPTCAHEFCFECILMWAEQSSKCPLCTRPFDSASSATNVQPYLIHHIRSNYDYQKYYLPPRRSPPPALRTDGDPSSSVTETRPRERIILRRRERFWGRRMHEEREQERAEEQLERAIARRKWVYERGLYAKHVASNRYTRYRPFPVPAQFASSPDLISRMTAWLRRELRVWPNLDVEFLTTFTISLMKSIDIRTESAIKLLAEFLDIHQPYVEGARYVNAEHFAHEIYCYLRSPYRDLNMYDQMVQYDIPPNLPPPYLTERRNRWTEDSHQDHSDGPSRSRLCSHARSSSSPSSRSSSASRSPAHSQRCAYTSCSTTEKHKNNPSMSDERDFLDWGRNQNKDKSKWDHGLSLSEGAQEQRYLKRSIRDPIPSYGPDSSQRGQDDSERGTEASACPRASTSVAQIERCRLPSSDPSFASIPLTVWGRKDVKGKQKEPPLLGLPTSVSKRHGGEAVLKAQGTRTAEQEKEKEKEKQAPISSTNSATTDLTVTTATTVTHSQTPGDPSTRRVATEGSTSGCHPKASDDRPRYRHRTLRESVQAHLLRPVAWQRDTTVASIPRRRSGNSDQRPEAVSTTSVTPISDRGRNNADTARSLLARISNDFFHSSSSHVVPNANTAN